MKLFKLKGNIVDVLNEEVYFGEITVENGKIKTIQRIAASSLNQEYQGFSYILPGFTDAHVHIESSMLTPAQFARIAVVHGTVSSISDPHEIANVCGIAGVNFMLDDAKIVPFKFIFGAPSCVPATSFETAGAALNAAAVELLLQNDEIKYLSEMMNFPGVLMTDKEVMEKIAAAKKYNKPIDGHSPGLRGDAIKKYIGAGISTDHECFTKEEALEKLELGMKILIREGSAAKNFDALIDLLNDFPDKIMLCSDDKHPDSLVQGHINQLCARAVAKGINLFKVLKAACVNPVLHYKTNVGLLRENDAADFIVTENLTDFNILQTFINGILVAEKGNSLIENKPSKAINHFNCDTIQLHDLKVFATEITAHKMPVIEALDGQLITNKKMVTPKIINGEIVSDIEKDVLKIVVVNRYKNAPVAKSFIKNFGLKSGALASSVAHDSHNIVAVGADDESILNAVNLVIKGKGGISAVGNSFQKILALPIAGLMSNEDGYKVAAAYTDIDKTVKEKLGSSLEAPFMTLSFMALLVIPHLKLSDKGLFDGDAFKFYTDWATTKVCG